jgi:hypothetical protein
MRAIVPATRQANQMPAYLANLEAVATAAIKRMGPAAYETFSNRIRGMAASGAGR